MPARLHRAGFSSSSAGVQHMSPCLLYTSKINAKGGKGAIAGDAVFEEVEPIVEAITPVPGGVGAVTTSVLIGHVAVSYTHLDVYKRQTLVREAARISKEQ